MKVSIIITSYNRPGTLDWTIQSVLRQTHKDLEVIIVDASQDEGAKHIAQKYADNRFRQRFIGEPYTRWERWQSQDDRCFKNMKSILVQNTGIADARNTGVEASTGSAYIFLDDDNWIEPEFVEKTAYHMQNPKIGIVTTDMHVFSEMSDSVVVSSITTPEILSRANTIHSSSLVRREAYVDVQGCKNDVYEDWELWLAILKKGWKMQAVNETLLHYRHTEGSLIARHAERHAERMMNMAKLHPDLFGESA